MRRHKRVLSDQAASKKRSKRQSITSASSRPLTTKKVSQKSIKCIKTQLSNHKSHLTQNSLQRSSENVFSSSSRSLHFISSFSSTSPLYNNQSYVYKPKNIKTSTISSKFPGFALSIDTPPTQSTPFQIKIRKPGVYGDITNKNDYTLTQEPISEITWPFEPLSDESLIKVETRNKEDAASQVFNDPITGKLGDSVEQLAQLSYDDLYDIAYAQGKYKHLHPNYELDIAKQDNIHNSKDNDNNNDNIGHLSKIADNKKQIISSNTIKKIQKKVIYDDLDIENDSNYDNDNDDEFFNEETSNDDNDNDYPTSNNNDDNNDINNMHRINNDNDDILILDETFDVLKAYSRLKNNPYKGLTDPIILPDALIKPPIINPRAAHAIALKYLVEAEQVPYTSNSGDPTNSESIYIDAKINRLNQQAILWMARASAHGEHLATVHMSHHCEDELNKKLRFYNDSHDEYDDNDNKDSNNKNIDITDKNAIDMHDAQIAHDERVLEAEIAYEEATKILMLRVNGIQLRSIDYRTMHPLISTLYYSEQLIQFNPTNNLQYMTQYCEWILGLDELFYNLLDKEDLFEGCGALVTASAAHRKNAPQQQPTNPELYAELLKNEKKEHHIYDDDDYTSDTDNGSHGRISNAEIVSSSSSENEEYTNSDNDDESFDPVYFRPRTFMSLYLGWFLRPYTIHPLYGPDAKLLLARILRTFGDKDNEADNLESQGRNEGGVIIEERIAMIKKQQIDEQNESIYATSQLDKQALEYELPQPLPSLSSQYDSNTIQQQQQLKNNPHVSQSNGQHTV